jgi:putative ABC transport system ATP-binding protein
VMVTHDLGTLDLVDEVHEMHSGRLTSGSRISVSE